MAALRAACDDEFQRDRLDVASQALAGARCPVGVVGGGAAWPSAFDEETRADDPDGHGLISVWRSFVEAPKRGIVPAARAGPSVPPPEPTPVDATPSMVASPSGQREKIATDAASPSSSSSSSLQSAPPHHMVLESPRHIDGGAPAAMIIQTIKATGASATLGDTPPKA